MKKLEFIKMEQVNAGRISWSCASGIFGFSAVFVVGLSALAGNPFAISAMSNTSALRSIIVASAAGVMTCGD